MPDTVSEENVSLLSGLRSPEKEKRAACTDEIVHHGRALVPDLTILLHDNDWKVRYRAAEALGLIGSDEAVPALIPACQDEKDHVRYMAAKSLGLIKSPGAVRILTRLLTDDHPYTRGIASEGLAAIRDRRGSDALEDAITRESIPELRERMAKNLALLKKGE